DEMDGESPFGLAQLEATLTRNPLTAPLMHPHPDFAHTYFVEVGGEKHPMTFDHKVYEANPDIGLLTYGHPVFEELIQRGWQVNLAAEVGRTLVEAGVDEEVVAVALAAVHGELALDAVLADEPHGE